MHQVRVTIRLKPSLLDSAGRTVKGSLEAMGFSEVADARIGKIIELQVNTLDEDRLKAMCTKLLANPVTEDFTIEVIR